MRLISPLLRHVVYPGLSRSGYLRRLASPAPAVLTYHGVVPSGDLPHPVLHDHLVTEDAFVSQLQLISSKYNPISPEQFLAWMEGKIELPSRSVLLTCDDGLLNTLTNMLPILQRFGLKCLFFVTADSTHRASSMLWFEELYVWLLRARKEAAIDVRPLPPMRLAHEPSQLHSSWVELTKRLSAMDVCSRKRILDELRTQLDISPDWDTEYSHSQLLRSRFFMLNVEELRRLQKAGMDVGAHTVSHPMLSQMDEGSAFQEIAESKWRLEAALGLPIWAFAFPFGNCDAVIDRDKELARRAGFKAAFMSVEEGSMENRYAVPRIHVSMNTTIAEVDAHLSGFYRSIRERFISPRTA